jgi:hypothetical protein
MKTFKQFIIESAKNKFDFKDNSLFVVNSNKKLHIVHTPEEDKGFDVFIEHEDVLPQFNYAMNDNDTTEENKHKPRPLSFGRIDHKNKMFYIISQAKGQPEGKEQYGRPDYTLMRKKDVENDVYNRLHTARAVHEKHPGYRIEVSGHPNHMVLSLPEYEKYLMSHLG